MTAPALEAQPGRRSEPVAAGDPRLGCVVLTYNRAAELLRTLEHLSGLPARPEILVVDNASTDGTQQQLRQWFPEVRCLRLKRNLGAAARNVGVRLCERPYVALCDDDTWWEAGSLRAAADLLDAHPRLAVVTARVLIGLERRIDPTCEAMARSPLPAPPGLPGAALLGFLAGASIVRRSALLAAGGFEPRFFLGGEEELLALDLVAAGWSLAYVEALTVHHHPSQQRDAAARRRLLLRNALWTAWLRRPISRALMQTAGLARRALEDAEARAALGEALRGLPWALRRRRVVPREVEQALRLLESEDEEPI